MALPDKDSARSWGGRLLVDTDGARIGTCVEIFVDDATGTPEWAAADVDGGTALIPLLDAVPADGDIRVSVRRDAVAGAPSVGDAHHLSQDEEERLYRHYGIAYSREESESGLPAGPRDVPPSAAGTTAPVLMDQPANGDRPAETADAIEPFATGGSRTTRTVLLVAAGLAGLVGLAVVIVVVLRARRRRQRPATRAQRVAARARTASRTVDARRAQALAASAPLLDTGRRVSVAAAQRAAVQAAATAQLAAQQVTALAEVAKTARQPAPEPSRLPWKRRRRA